MTVVTISPRVTQVTISRGPAGVGVPTGGATAQVLRKTSATDYDTAWADPSVTAAQISDSSAAGRSLLTATDDAAQRTLLSLAAIAASGSASDLSAGTVPAARMPAHTGDVTSSAGSVALTVGAGAVTLAKMANLAANSILGNNTGSAATPIALTAAQVRTLLALATVATSGSAADLSAGTLADARLSANVPLLNTANAFTAAQFIDTGAGALTAGLFSPSFRVAAADGANARWESIAHGGAGLVLAGRSIGGTRSAPTATPAGRTIFSFQAFGHDGSAYTTTSSATYLQIAPSLWSSTNRETAHTWEGTPTGSTTLAEWMRLQNACLGIGVTPTVSAGLLQLATGTTKANGILFGNVPVYRFQSYGLAVDTNASSGHQVRIYDDASGPTLAIRAADNVYAQLMFRTHNGVTEDDRFRARADGSGLLWQTWNGSAWMDMLKVSTAGVLAFYGAGGSTRQTAAAAATDAATTQTLANSLRTILINLGLAQ